MLRERTVGLCGRTSDSQVFPCFIAFGTLYISVDVDEVDAEVGLMCEELPTLPVERNRAEQNGTGRDKAGLVSNCSSLDRVGVITKPEVKALSIIRPSFRLWYPNKRGDLASPVPDPPICKTDF